MFVVGFKIFVLLSSVHGSKMRVKQEGLMKVGEKNNTKSSWLDQNSGLRGRRNILSVGNKISKTIWNLYEPKWTSRKILYLKYDAYDGLMISFWHGCGGGVGRAKKSSLHVWTLGSLKPRLQWPCYCPVVLWYLIDEKNALQLKHQNLVFRNSIWEAENEIKWESLEWGARKLRGNTTLYWNTEVKCEKK